MIKFSLKILLLLILFVCTRDTLIAQVVAVKSNLLYDASGTINLGVEVALNNKFTLDVSGNLNPWTYNKRTNSKLRNILIQPELRYWLCEAFAGHFFGVHAHWAYYNVGALDLPFGLTENTLKKYRYEGNLYGAGVNYGYQWSFKNRWAVETEIGVGYAYLDHNKYQCDNCGKLLGKEKLHYVGLTKAAVSLIFFIK